MYRKIWKILNNLKKNKNSAPFLFPVDPIALGCLDYYSYIKEPMDLATVEQNLKNFAYSTHIQFATDVRKIWNNSFMYNAKGNLIFFLFFLNFFILYFIFYYVFYYVFFLYFFNFIIFLILYFFNFIFF